MGDFTHVGASTPAHQVPQVYLNTHDDTHTAHHDTTQLTLSNSSGGAAQLALRATVKKAEDQ